MKTTNCITCHGVFMNIFGMGTFLTGESGIGKSELALSLIDRGHRLIADDAAEFIKTNQQTLNGTCPTILQDLLEVRGLGVLNIRKLFGYKAIQKNAPLNFIIHLKVAEKIQILPRLEGLYGEEQILNISIPTVVLPVSSGRDLKVLTECAVLNQLLKLQGDDAKQELIRRQRLQLKKTIL
jgi:HPr kinase/phosphorylase